MASPKGFILYKIWYGDCLAYLGRTKQPLQARIRGHMFAKPMHRAINIHNVTKIEYTKLQTEADMNLYEIYFINLYKPPLNIDDKAQDNLTIQLPELKWEDFIPSKWEDWKIELSSDDMWGWHKDRNQKIFLDD
jgi:hypothetical protein